MPRSAYARIFLKLNSQFSALNGIVLLLGAGLVAPLIFANPAAWAPMGLRGLGVGLFGFAALVFALSKNKFVTRRAVNEIVLLDVLWVVASVVLIAFMGDLFTRNGIVLVTLVAMVVAFFAITQFASAAKITPPLPVAEVIQKNGKLYANVRREVNAPTDVVWDIMTDHPSYSDVASNISKVEVLSGNGLGMKRRCYGPKGENWEETCDVFEPGQSFGFRIHTEADDYPYPIGELKGRWSVKPAQDGSEFDIQIVATPKGNAITKWLFVTLAKQQFKTILIDLADGWAERMENEAVAQQG